jgi:hypothetical protein
MTEETYQDRVRRRMAQDHPDFAACEAPRGKKLDRASDWPVSAQTSAQIIDG